MQLNLDETAQAALRKVAEQATEEEQEKARETRKRKSPGKLPRPDKPMAKDSREAAAEMLREFFRSR